METRGSLIDRIVLGISIVLILALVCIIIYSSVASAELLNLKTESKNYSKEQVENNSFFDIFITIPQNYEKVEPNTELLTNVKLINLGGAGRVDVLMNYEIKDLNDKTILTKKETVAVETQANFVRTFDIPQDTLPGKYKVYVKLVYADGKEAAAEASFEIVKAENQKTKDYFIYGSLAVIILAILIYLSIKSKVIIERVKMKLQIRSIVKKKLG
jgi:hypothetical protein